MSDVGDLKPPRLDSLDRDAFSSFYLENSAKKTAQRFGVHSNTTHKWAKRLGLHKKKIKNPSMGIEPTEVQKQIIIGSMLGDGSISYVPAGRSDSHFKEKHSMAQYGWLEWKRRHLDSLGAKIGFENAYARKQVAGSVVNDTTRMLSSCRLHTRSLRFLTEAEREWYKRDENGEYVKKAVGSRLHRIKIVPRDLVLTPLSLAVWYMDDGCNTASRGSCRLYCLSFSIEEVEFLRTQIEGMGFFNSMIHGSSGGQGRYTISILRRSVVDFLGMVSGAIPDLPDCMKYKVDVSGVRPMRTSITGARGVYPAKGGYGASVKVSGSTYALGVYDEISAASSVAEKAREMRANGVTDQSSYREMVFEMTGKMVLSRPRVAGAGAASYPGEYSHSLPISGDADPSEKMMVAA